MKKIAALGLVLLLAACNGRLEPDFGFLDPVCMPDGSVVYAQMANAKDEYGQPRASKANCAWNKPAAAK
jgi:hypothetical protein